VLRNISEGAHGDLVRKPEGQNHLEDLGVGEKVMDIEGVRWVAWTGLIWLRIGIGGRIF
jgi:hypothetical protein